ncbi:metallophosphoesterase family protein [Gloeocapsa sp. PCC 73106]|uniref:metallophosphoesterase family protein n=1 Tax=Gloeocapsa sp. PCC 73106 TaxID=102232 RepID=UPI0002AC45EA|nr:metallophosphoesterase family protein [Gloeocapsa sp. PCC 73106]ELR97668.1 Calcineurin-like phosphoesterase [Gloeocapsa sp. PCC 73106]
MPNRRIIIGDVHGHYEALISLLEAIAPSQEDQIYFLGDLIDRGPHSAQVVQFVISNNYKCVLGNHEKMLLNTIGSGQVQREELHVWLYCGGYSTLESYQNNIPQEHLTWFKELPLYLDLGDIWLVHAGVDPRLPIENQSSDQFCWIRKPFHGMTQPYFADKLIVSGHTITFTLPGVKPGKLAQGRGWIDIETGVYHPKSGWLTALDIDQEQIHQINTKDRVYRCLSFKQGITHIDPSKINDLKDIDENLE